MLSSSGLARTRTLGRRGLGWASRLGSQLETGADQADDALAFQWDQWTSTPAQAVDPFQPRALLPSRSLLRTVSARHVHLPGGNDGGEGDEPKPKGGAAATGWVGRLPPSLSPYARLMRLDKPIGSWLLAWPSFWSIGLAAAQGAPPDPWTLALFGSGAVLLRGAGCTINDLWDRDLDSKVERTRSRPLAAGEVTPASAVAFLGAQLSLGLGILLQLNTFSQALGAASLPLVVAYPLMKRVTNWPQAVLGLTINWGALLGWAAVHGSLDLGVTLPLYLSGVAWTLVYDTIYAHQDKADDVKIGVKSTALHFGSRNKEVLTAFALAHGAGLVLSGLAGGCGGAYYAASALGTSWLAKSIRDINLDDPKECGDFFVRNQWYGALIFSGIVLDRLM